MTSSSKGIRSAGSGSECDPLLTPEQVAKRLNAKNERKGWQAAEVGSPESDQRTRGTAADSLTGSAAAGLPYDPLWTPEQVADRLNVSPDWVRDHSSRKEPRLPVIRLGGGPGRAGLLRYRASRIEKFIEEMERLSERRRRAV
jgi:hypothetical protein